MTGGSLPLGVSVQGACKAGPIVTSVSRFFVFIDALAYPKSQPCRSLHRRSGPGWSTRTYLKHTHGNSGYTMLVKHVLTDRPGMPIASSLGCSIMVIGAVSSFCAAYRGKDRLPRCYSNLLVIIFSAEKQLCRRSPSPPVAFFSSAGFISC